MKTAAKDLVRLMALLESQSNATNSLRASHAIGEGSFNSMKVDYQKWGKEEKRNEAWWRMSVDVRCG